MAKRKPKPIRLRANGDTPAVTLYAPGTRKRNATWVCRGTVDGHNREAASDRGGEASEAGAWEWWRDYCASLRRQSGAVRQGQPRTLTDLMGAWIALKRPSRQRVRYFEKLRDDPVAGPMPLVDVTEHDLHQAALRLYPGCKGQTLNGNAISPWTTALRYAARQGWCAPVLVERFTEEAVAPRRPKPGSMEALIRAADTMGRRDVRDWSTFIAFQGWRLTESLTPAPDAIDWENETILVFVKKARRGDVQGVWKRVPLHPRTMAMFRQRRADGMMDGPRIWPWHNRHQLYVALDPVLLRAGLARIKGYRVCKNGRRKNGKPRHVRKPIIERFLTPHMARHEWGSQTAEKGLTGHDQADGNTWTSARTPSLKYRTISEEHRRRIASTVAFDLEDESGEEPGEAKASA